MDQLVSLFSYDEKANYWDFKPGNWWKIHEVKAVDNLTFSKAYDFEQNVDYTKVHHWFQDNWDISVKLALVYVILVFGGQAYMKNRERFTLQGPLVIWNLLLAGFSIFGTIRIWQVCFEMYWRHGIKGTICHKEYFTSPVSNFWSMVFILSKVPELIDTAFIVLRKQKLIFLHWYHHITVMIYSWYTFRDRMSGAQWYVGMNFFVHALMYSYYACRALKIRIPRPIAMTITALQLSQMFVGVWVQFYIYSVRKDPECPTHYYNLRAAVIMYGSYYLLFAQFFIKAYIFPSKKPATKAKVEPKITEERITPDENQNSVRRRRN